MHFWQCGISPNPLLVNPIHPTCTNQHQEKDQGRTLFSAGGLPPSQVTEAGWSEKDIIFQTLMESAQGGVDSVSAINTPVSPCPLVPPSIFPHHHVHKPAHPSLHPLHV